MIYLENLSIDEKKAIKALYARIINDLPKKILDEDAAFLYRFLKARDFDVDKAENMVRRNISWRKHFQIETILEDFTPKPPSKAVQFVGILNLDKLTLANATSRVSVDQCVRILHALQDNYPETLSAAYVINAPGYYVFIWSILKSLMSSALMEKIHVYGSSDWQEKLLEVIDADVLPAFLGGNRTDPDGNPLCNTFVMHGGNIPENYFLPEEERNFTNRSPVKRITIPPRQKKEITVHVTETGSRIHWEFLIKSKDVGFGVFYRMSEMELEEVLPIEKYDTTDGVEKGSYKLQCSGNYILVFDNTDSWMNSKEVDYCITVLT